MNRGRRSEEIFTDKQDYNTFLELKKVVRKVYDVNMSDLLVPKRGVFNEPRNVAIYLTRRLRYNGLDEICKGFQMSKYSSASSAMERMKNKLFKSMEMRKRVEK